MSVSEVILTIVVMLFYNHSRVLLLGGFLIAITDFFLRSLDLHTEDVDDCLGSRSVAVLLGFLSLRLFLILIVPVRIELLLDPANDTTILLF
jgi:hypothetical protein